MAVTAFIGAGVALYEYSLICCEQDNLEQHFNLPMLKPKRYIWLGENTLLESFWVKSEICLRKGREKAQEENSSYSVTSSLSSLKPQI